MSAAEKLLKLSEQARQVLQAQDISTAGPGSILSDVQVMMDLIGPEGIPTQSKQGNLPAAALPELNRRLSAPIALHLNRPLLRDYPNVAGVYVLLRVMDLAQTERGRLSLNQEALSFWNDLNPVEKYFALLEAWLFYAEDAVLGGSAWHVFEQFSSNFLFLAAGVSCRCWKTFPEHCHTYSREGISTWNVQLQARFGLVEVQGRPVAGRETSTRGWLLKKAKRTAWGEAVAWAIADRLARKEHEEREADGLDEDDDADDADYWFYRERPEAADFGFLKPAFAPYFPEWSRVYYSREASKCPGRYVFKVALDSRRHAPAWRRLAVPDSLHLEYLADEILEAFKFIDKDHGYEFRFQDPLGKLRIYYHPYSDQGPWAHEIDVGETGLRETQVMKFKFDYGDNWEFTLRVERIDPSDDNPEVEVIASEGDAPEQYPTQS